jgi:anti-sigma regulatory factor (Ser/Thr protein kinase)
MTTPMSSASESGIKVRGGTQAARDARGAVTSQLGGRLVEGRVRDLNLVISEIVNNSVLHGGVDEDGWIEIDYSISDTGIRVEIKDTGLQGNPEPREPDPESGGGFGLFIVDALSRRWGVEHDPVLCVWFEFELDGTT